MRTLKRDVNGEFGGELPAKNLFDLGNTKYVANLKS